MIGGIETQRQVEDHLQTPVGMDAEQIQQNVAQRLTRESELEFNVADAKRPLASAVKVVKAKNRVILDEDGSFIQNKVTGECMEVRIEKDTFVFDVEYQNGEPGTIVLDSGVGVSVWPKGKMGEVALKPRDPKLRMTAANGSEIKHYGRKLIKFRGIDVTSVATKTVVSEELPAPFARQAK